MEQRRQVRDRVAATEKQSSGELATEKQSSGESATEKQSSGAAECERKIGRENERTEQLRESMRERKKERGLCGNWVVLGT